MNRLNELLSLCDNSVLVFINQHRNWYETVAEHISEQDREDIPNDVFSEMIKRNSVVRIQAYPNTPISFALVHHYDLNTAIELAINEIKGV